MNADEKIKSFAPFAGSLGNILPVLPSMAWGGLAVLFEVGGALLILVGYKTRIGAWMLIVLTIIATIIGHTTVFAPTGTPFQVDWVGALKNLAIIGGLLLVAKHGNNYMSLAQKMRAESMNSGTGM